MLFLLIGGQFQILVGGLWDWVLWVPIPSFSGGFWACHMLNRGLVLSHIASKDMEMVDPSSSTHVNGEG